MIQYLYLGRLDYGEALALQRELVEMRHQGRIENTLLLLEHPPVLTLGRNSTRSNILASDEMLVRKGIEIHEINRGGDVTYHGPGQLVGYPIFDLRSLSNGSGGRLGPVDYVRRVEEALIRLCAGYGVITGRIAGRTGVWTKAWSGSLDGPTGAGGSEKKIAAIGIHVSRGITSHGFAFNLSTDLRDFQIIVPCGIADRDVTSLDLEIPDPAGLPTLAQLADAAARQFGHVFEQQVLAIEDVAALRAMAGRAEPGLPSSTGLPALPALPGRETPVVGAPMRVPREIQALRDEAEPQLRALSGRPTRA